MNRLLSNVFWFGVGLLVVLLLFLTSELAYGQSEYALSRKSELTIKSMAEELDKKESTQLGLLYATYISGLAKGAYATYIYELVTHGMEEGTASLLAAKRCGELTPGELYAILKKDARLAAAPVTISVPFLVSSICHYGENNT